MKQYRAGLAATSLGLALLLAACGGGGGGEGPASTAAPVAPAGPAAPATSVPEPAGVAATTTAGEPATPATPEAPTVSAKAELPVTVIDGAIRNARVCLDRNGNSACDAEEPSGVTDAAGKVTLKLDHAEVGRFPVVAEVGTDAVDAEHGPVGKPFVLKAPADRPGVVSPLTTLVQASVEGSGVSSAIAEAGLRELLAVRASLFDDFTQGNNADAGRQAALARLLVLAGQEQTALLASSVGQQASDGQAITVGDLRRAVELRLLQALPAALVKLTDDRLAAATPASRSAVLSTLAQELAASPSLGLTTSTLYLTVGASRSTDTANQTGRASVSMTSLSFLDAQVWTRRAFLASALQNTPDGEGQVRFVERRWDTNGGAVAIWGAGTTPDRSGDLHWNGSAWVRCPLDFESRQTVGDAQGRSRYDYCDGREQGIVAERTQDLSGRLMTDVYRQMEAAFPANLFIENADAVLGTRVFPAGAKLLVKNYTRLSMAPLYRVGLGSWPRTMRADLAAGEPAACADYLRTGGLPPSTYSAPATTLESFIAANRGTPCVLAPETLTQSVNGVTTTVSSGSRNEWWGQSTAIVDLVIQPGEDPASYYTNDTQLRVAFGPEGTVLYYVCRQRSDGWPRNCDQVGTGTYSISSLGDARVLAYHNEPAQFARVRFRRIYVERGGKVYSGFLDRPAPYRQLGLNLEAANALSEALGLPRIDPLVPPGLTAASYRGAWFVDSNLPQDRFSGLSLFVSERGLATTCYFGSVNYHPCTFSLDPATGAFTYSMNLGIGSGTLDLATGLASGTFTPASGAPVPLRGVRN